MGEPMTDAVGTRVLVVDDHQTFAELLGDALDREPDFICVGHATTGADAVTMTEALGPDVVVMDVELPDMDGFAATKRILILRPDVRVVVLTAHGSPDFVAKASAAGACGFLPKDGSLAVMLQTLRSARPGSLAIHPALVARMVAPPRRPEQCNGDASPTLTQRERQVLDLMGRGRDVRAIARELGISTHTSRGYVKAILLKLDSHTQLEAVVAATRLGLLRLDASG
jgi:DNA-binding NarL/FixJ family response regulator